MSKDDKFYGNIIASVIFVMVIMVLTAGLTEVVMWAFKWWKGVLV